MSKITRILMNRDGLTEEEAKELVEECKEAIASGDEYAIEDILGLEDDYFDFLF